jgi:DNA modification methylase
VTIARVTFANIDMNEPLSIIAGDALEQLVLMPSESVHCCVTSPPYSGLRDYSTDGQLGLEKTPDEYVPKMVELFREVRRVLRKDGTLWLNLGDSYAGSPGGSGGWDGNNKNLDGTLRTSRTACERWYNNTPGLKPWRVAFALQADGWWLRSDIIWAKPNPMPESCTDRPTKSHEYLFLLTKSANYFYDAEAIREPADTRIVQKPAGWNQRNGRHDTIEGRYESDGTTAEISGRNKRSVWTIATAPYPEAHFATYPPDLVKPCILAGTSAKGCCAKCGAPWERLMSERDGNVSDAPSDYTQAFNKGPMVNVGHGIGAMGGGHKRQQWLDEHPKKTIGWQPTCKCDAGIAPCTVLDPFAGSGTTGMVALELGRRAILIELNPKYIALIEQRCNTTMGLALA